LYNQTLAINIMTCIRMPTTVKRTNLTTRKSKIKNPLTPTWLFQQLVLFIPRVIIPAAWSLLHQNNQGITFTPTKVNISLEFVILTDMLLAIYMTSATLVVMCRWNNQLCVLICSALSVSLNMHISSHGKPRIASVLAPACGVAVACPLCVLYGASEEWATGACIAVNIYNWWWSVMDRYFRVNITPSNHPPQCNALPKLDGRKIL
jgi:hypothetical protein